MAMVIFKALRGGLLDPRQPKAQNRHAYACLPLYTGTV
jgi:hypothetical protein